MVDIRLANVILLIILTRKEPIDLSFEGKVVLITGAGGGIGKETARLFHEQGALLALVDIDESTLRKAAEELRLENYLLIQADVSKENEVKKYTESTVKKFGRIDVFFNNAGIVGSYAKITKVSSEDFNRVVDINLKGVFYGLKHVLRVMKKQRSGCIVNTSSVAGLNGSPSLGPYAATKHAVIGLTKTAAVEVAEDGIRVNAICPAPVDTKLMEDLDEIKSPGNPMKAREAYEQKIPLKRYATPTEVAEVVLFLSSEKASYMTGCAIPIEGGYTSTF